ncbi:hypothetical protein ITI46_07755 [Streptomyces oryzae]|uniref:SnoaL-like domain-containing protein n=1 Tax=Streptomyces oryzae TaxID=1434886 RepID=A0ABS3X957_9ACTN|nr:hypothetical protein [Streptomyces oryzae]MBO8191587.1 hypothetical protein [Streptomyces oryzae]
MTYLRNFDQVIEEFAEFSGETAKTAAEALPCSTVAREGVAQAAFTHMNPEMAASVSYPGCGPDDEAVRWRAWLSPPNGVELLSFNSVTGHVIEGEVWYTARIRWLLQGLALAEDGESATMVACVWPVKMLFSTDNGEDGLRRRRFCPITGQLRRTPPKQRSESCWSRCSRRTPPRRRSRARAAEGSLSPPGRLPCRTRARCSGI